MPGELNVDSVAGKHPFTGRDDIDKDDVQFDFLVHGELLRTSLYEHLVGKGIPLEGVKELEYIEKQAAPRPRDDFQHDDWVSSVQQAGTFILSGSYDSTVRLWSVKDSYYPIMTIPGHSGAVKCVRWIEHDEAGHTSRFVTGSQDQTACVWRWDHTNNEIDCQLSCRGHAASVDCVSVGNFGQQVGQLMCTGSWDKMLKLWSTACDSPAEDDPSDESRPAKRLKADCKVQTRVPVLTLSGHTEAVSGVQWTDSHTVATSSWDHSIRLWDMEHAKQVSLLPGPKVFLGIAFSPLSKTLVAACADRHIRLVDPRADDAFVIKCSLTSHAAWVSSVCWSPVDEYMLLSGSYDTVLKLWDTRSPKVCLYDMKHHCDKILSVDWSVPQTLLSGGADNQLHTVHLPRQTVHVVDDS